MRESKTCILIHYIWATWDRLPLLVGERREIAYQSIVAECQGMRAKVLAIGGTDNHVHLLVEIPASVPVALVMKQAKGASAHLLNTVANRDGYFKWQGAYGAYSVGHAELPTIIRYIQNQEQHHGSDTVQPDFEVSEP